MVKLGKLYLYFLPGFFYGRNGPQLATFLRRNLRGSLVGL